MNTTALTQNVQPTMSSREIADLTGKRHDNVKRDINSMLADLELDVLRFEGIYRDGQNREQKQYLLDRELTDCLLTGYSAKARMAVIKRWRELESREEKSDPMKMLADPAAMRDLLLGYTERVLELESQVSEQAPKVQFADRVQISHDAITIAEAAKTIGTGRNRLCAFLRSNSWINRRNEPYQAKIEAGLMDVKVGQWEHPEKGLKESITALLTGKGLIKIQRLWDEQKGAAA